ncbi:MAG: bis(5'-nucleosyl)-tetraphosphatase (symmetrical) YqeK [Chloroflexi bacterium]|nr:bis(5'-nucleosyl)-tetraphosphatase (symmetrical) YqeK [Chloroflexota bacterium]
MNADAHGSLASPDLELRARMAAELPLRMSAHIDRVVALADELARTHGLDVGRARLMAQGHDLVRAVPAAELLRRAEARGLTIDPVERDEPVILHGPIGALELCERFGLTDESVLFAIHWHTTGHPEYDGEAWAMFIADKVDPRKVKRWPALAEVRALADDSLEAAALRYLDLRVDEAVERRWSVHPMATLTRNALLRRLGHRPQP